MAYGTRTPEAQKGKRQELGRCLSPGCERSRSASARYGSSENWPTPQKEAYQDSGLSPEKGFKISGLRQGSQSKISSLRCFFSFLGNFLAIFRSYGKRVFALPWLPKGPRPEPQPRRGSRFGSSQLVDKQYLVCLACAGIGCLAQVVPVGLRRKNSVLGETLSRYWSCLP